MLKLEDNRFIIIDIIVIYLNSEQANSGKFTLKCS